MSLPHKSKSWFNSYIIVYNVNGGTRTIPIVLSPTGVSEAISASYDQQTSPGRSAPVISYSSTGAKTLNFTMRVSVDTLPSGYNKNIDSYISLIRSLMYPDYSTKKGIIQSPHCKVVIGNIKLDGVCTSFNVSYSEVHAKNGSYAVADIDLGFLEVLAVAPGNVNIINGSAATNGTSNTVKDVSPGLTVYLSGTYSGSGSSSNPYKIGRIEHGYNPAYKLKAEFIASCTPYSFTECLVDGQDTERYSWSSEYIFQDYTVEEANYYLTHGAWTTNGKPIVFTFKLKYDGKIIDGQKKKYYIIIEHADR